MEAKPAWPVMALKKKGPGAKVRRATIQCSKTKQSLEGEPLFMYQNIVISKKKVFI